MAKEPKKKSPLLEEETETVAPVEKEAPEEGAKPATAAHAAPKKEAKAPAAAPVNVQHDLLSDAEATRRTLMREEKVWFMVPLGQSEKPGAYEEVYINGYRTTIKKGVMVEIPRSVMEILANKYKVETEAGAEFRTDRDAKTQDALD